MDKITNITLNYTEKQFIPYRVSVLSAKTMDENIQEVPEIIPIKDVQKNVHICLSTLSDCIGKRQFSRAPRFRWGLGRDLWPDLEGPTTCRGALLIALSCKVAPFHRHC